MNSFTTFHPFVLVMYFGFVFTILISSMHPIVLVLGAIGAISYFCTFKGFIQTIREFVYYLFVCLLIFIAYSAFVHNGVTPLFFLNDQPVTLQVLIKASFIGISIVAVMFFLKCFLEIFTTTKVLFLATKISSSFGLFLSMFIRFIPLCKERFAERQYAMKAIGYYKTSSRFDRCVRYVKVLMQTVITTVELVFFKPQVMKARAYGKQKRTQYNIIRWTRKDYIFLLFLILCGVIFTVMYTSYTYYYFPTLKPIKLTLPQLFIVGIVMLLPTVYEIKENAKWRSLQSKI